LGTVALSGCFTWLLQVGWQTIFLQMKASYNKYCDMRLFDALKWTEPLFQPYDVNQAGRFFRGEGKISEEKAHEILNNFRAAHSYPMQVFYVRLRDRSQALDRNSLAAQRLKRASSIIAKLTRPYHGHRPSMDLYQMQDIGGCRAIMSSVDLAKRLAEEEYVKGDLKHKLVGKGKDYISNPKPDGYRGIHLVYRYNSDKPNKMMYNKLLLEIQIRSKLQHLWATAVETVGFFTGQAIKSNEGSPEWNEFFRLVSSAFAKMENCPLVPATPSDEKVLYSRIREQATQLNVINKLEQWATAMDIIDDRDLTKGAKFFLLELNINKQTLSIRSYRQSEEQVALTRYAELEKKHTGNKDFDVVLAGVNAAKDLRKAYPNYYVDMREFGQKLKGIIQKA
jgi:ppGpp synthetase/RelA/SpoT-type nucleotidyltranferase